MVVIGLAEISANLSESIRAKYSQAPTVDFAVGDTITGADTGATAIIDSIDTVKRELKVIPTSEVYFTAGEVIKTPAILLMSELALLEVWHEMAVDMIIDYTANLYGSVVPKELKFTTFRLPETRYINILDGPLASVVSVVLGDQTLTEDNEYVVHLKHNRIEFGHQLHRGRYGGYGMRGGYGIVLGATLNNLVINITFGTTTIPPTVKAAALLLMSWLWSKRNARIGSKGAQSFSFAGRSVNWGTLASGGGGSEFAVVNAEITSMLRLKARILVG